MKLLKLYLLRLALLLLTISIFALALQAQVQEDTANHKDDAKEVMKSPKELLDEFIKLESKKNTMASQKDIVQDGYANDERLDSVQLEAWKNYYGYMSKGYIHRANVFSWQLLSSIIIFCVVIFLVFAGIYFAWLQFKYALGRKSDPELLSTELSASMKEIKVSSPVLGVIILIISLFFFYLYLVFVYPIQDIF